MIWLWLLAGHLAGDFVLQSDKLVRLKETNLLRGLTAHVFIHAGLYILITALYWGMFGGSVFLLLCTVAVISILHLIIDFLKVVMSRKLKSVGAQIFLFLTDQSVHIFVIAGTVFILSPGGVQWETVYPDLAAVAQGTYDWHYADRAAAIVCLVITGTYAAGYFLGILLQNVAPKDDIQKDHYVIENERTEVRTKMLPNGERESEITTVKSEQLYRDSPQKTGRYIGMLERLLIMILLVTQLSHGLAFLAALKSLTRFKQFDNKQFAEYYLTGTIASAIIGLLIGILAAAVIQ
jgi:hypothetical protein